MDFQAELRKAGRFVQEIGDELLEAAEKEDIGILRPLRDQLSEIINGLNSILIVDNLAQPGKRD